MRLATNVGFVRFNLSAQRGEKIRTKEQREEWFARKPAVMAILERGGRVRTGIVADVTAKTLGDALRENVDPAKSTLYTDEFKSYRPVGKQFSGGSIFSGSRRLGVKYFR